MVPAKMPCHHTSCSTVFQGRVHCPQLSAPLHHHQVLCQAVKVYRLTQLEPAQVHDHLAIHDSQLTSAVASNIVIVPSNKPSQTTQVDRTNAPCPGSPPSLSPLHPHYAKNLTKHIKQAVKWSDLRLVLSQHAQHMNAIHVSALITHLAQITPAAQQVAREQSGFNSFLASISQLVASQLEQLDARAFANILWAVAKLGFCPSSTLLNQFLFQCYVHMSEFKPQELSNLLWALATMKCKVAESWYTKCCIQLRLCIHSMRPQELSNTAWALQQLKVYPGEQVLDTMLQIAVTDMAAFKPSELIILLSSLVKLHALSPLGQHPTASLQSALSSLVHTAVTSCSNATQSVAAADSTPVASSVSDSPGTATISSRACHTTQAEQHHCGQVPVPGSNVHAPPGTETTQHSQRSSQTAQTCPASSTDVKSTSVHQQQTGNGHSPDHSCEQPHTADHPQGNMQHTLSAQASHSSLTSKLMDPSLWQRATRFLYQHHTSLCPQDFATWLVLLSKLPPSCILETATSARQPHLSATLKACHHQDAQPRAASCASTSHTDHAPRNGDSPPQQDTGYQQVEGPSVLHSVSFLVMESRYQVHLFTPQALSNTIWALAHLQVMPDINWQRAFYHQSYCIASSFTPQALSNTLWACARLGLKPPRRWLNALLHCTCLQLASFNIQELANLAWALARMQVPLSERFVVAVTAAIQQHVTSHPMPLRETVQLLQALSIFAESYTPASPCITAEPSTPASSCKTGLSSLRPTNASRIHSCAQTKPESESSPSSIATCSTSSASKPAHSVHAVVTDAMVQLVHSSLQGLHNSSPDALCLLAKAVASCTPFMLHPANVPNDVDRSHHSIPRASQASSIHAGADVPCHQSQPSPSTPSNTLTCQPPAVSAPSNLTSWMQEWQSAVLSQLPRYSITHVCKLMHALSTLPDKPPPQLVQSILAHAARLPHICADDVSMLLKFCLRLGYRPSSVWLQHMLAKTQGDLQSLDAATLSTLLSRLMLLRYRPQAPWMVSYLAASYHLLPTPKPCQVIKLLRSLGKMKIRMRAQYVTGLQRSVYLAIVALVNAIAALGDGNTALQTPSTTQEAAPCNLPESVADDGFSAINEAGMHWVSSPDIETGDFRSIPNLVAHINTAASVAASKTPAAMAHDGAQTTVAGKRTTAAAAIQGLRLLWHARQARIPVPRKYHQKLLKAVVLPEVTHLPAHMLCRLARLLVSWQYSPAYRSPPVVLDPLVTHLLCADVLKQLSARRRRTLRLNVARLQRSMAYSSQGMLLLHARRDQRCGILLRLQNTKRHG